MNSGFELKQEAVIVTWVQNAIRAAQWRSIALITGHSDDKLEV